VKYSRTGMLIIAHLFQLLRMHIYYLRVRCMHAVPAGLGSTDPALHRQPSGCIPNTQLPLTCETNQGTVTVNLLRRARTLVVYNSLPALEHQHSIEARHHLSSHVLFCSFISLTEPKGGHWSIGQAGRAPLNHETTLWTRR
jgi:hypothetical protein